MEVRNVAAHVHARVVLHQAMLICCRASHEVCLKSQGTGDTPQQFEAAFRVLWPFETACIRRKWVSCSSLQDRHSHQCPVPCQLQTQVCSLAAPTAPPCRMRAHSVAPRDLHTGVMCSMLCSSASCPTQCMPNIPGQLNTLLVGHTPATCCCSSFQTAQVVCYDVAWSVRSTSPCVLSASFLYGMFWTTLISPMLRHGRQVPTKAKMPVSADHC